MLYNINGLSNLLRDKVLDCSHSLSKSCLNRLLSLTCPICRAVINQSQQNV